MIPSIPTLVRQQPRLYLAVLCLIALAAVGAAVAAGFAFARDLLNTQNT